MIRNYPSCGLVLADVESKVTLIDVLIHDPFNDTMF